MDFETKRQKVLAYIKGLKTMPVVVTKGPAPEPVAVIDGVAYFHKQEFDLEAIWSLENGTCLDILTGEQIEIESWRDVPYMQKASVGGGYFTAIQFNYAIHVDSGSSYALNPSAILKVDESGHASVNYTSRAFKLIDTYEGNTDEGYVICLPTCSAYYGFLSEDGKTFISYYNLKDDGAPTETIMVPVYDQNGVDPEKIEALKAIAAGGKVGEELLDEIVNFIDNPPVPYEEITHAYLTVPADSLTATFDCGTLIDGAEAKVDWGDGMVEDLTANTRMTHTYAAAGDYEVKISGMAAFKYSPYPGATVFFKEHLREIVLSNLITEIANYAITFCTSLTSITIPNSVINIGTQSFYDCANLVSITVDPGNQTYYSEGNCLIRTSDNALVLGCKTSIIPNCVTRIGTAAFQKCIGLTSVTIPDSVTSIGEQAFQGCSGLTSVTVGSGVTSIVAQTFYGCSSLAEVIFEDSREAVPTLPDINAFGNLPEGYKIYVQRDLLSAWKAANNWSTIADHIEGLPWTDGHIHGVIKTTSSSQSVTFVSGSLIENVDHKIDWGDGTIEDLTAGSSITHTYATTGEYDLTIKGTSTIADNAFRQCTSLTSITIPDSVTSIGSDALAYCTGLTSVTIGSGVTSIGMSSFAGCTGLTSITIPDNVTSIGVYAFQNCSALTSIAIPGSVTSIGHGAFNGCTGLTSVVIHDGVTKIGNDMFNNCTSLASIVIPNSVTSIGSSAFIDCSGLTSVTIGSGVTSIGTSAFQNCTELTSITISNNVSIIGQTAFAGCTGLTSVNIGSGVNTIGQSSFWKCTGLTSIAIPKSVAHINKYAFEKCSSLAEVIFEDGREAIPSLSDANAFTENATGRKFYVQSDLLDAWKAATNWATYAADIEALPAA